MTHTKSLTLIANTMMTLTLNKCTVVKFLFLSVTSQKLSCFPQNEQNNLGKKNLLAVNFVKVRVVAINLKHYLALVILKSLSVLNNL